MRVGYNMKYWRMWLINWKECVRRESWLVQRCSSRMNAEKLRKTMETLKQNTRRPCLVSKTGTSLVWSSCTNHFIVMFGWSLVIKIQVLNMVQLLIFLISKNKKTVQNSECSAFFSFPVCICSTHWCYLFFILPVFGRSDCYSRVVIWPSVTFHASHSHILI